MSEEAEPSLAARSRALVAAARVAALGTHSKSPPGFPYTSLVACADDGQGRPILLLSSLAEHTKNLAGDDGGPGR
jgi:putative heme iron utilization protein